MLHCKRVLLYNIPPIHQAVCHPTEYRVRMLEWGRPCLLLLYTLPAIAASLVINLPR